MNEAEKTTDTQKNPAAAQTGSKVNKTLKKLKGIKNIEIIIAVLAVAVMLVIYFSSRLGSKEAVADGTTEAGVSENYCERMERQLTEAVAELKGAGKAKVIINWESGIESVIAYITSEGSGSSSSSPQLIQSSGGSKPIVLKEIYPKALGVIIICQGGESVSVKLDIINAVSMLLGLSPDKINVYPMK